LSRPQAEALRQAFAEFRPALVEQPLGDFSGLRFGAHEFCALTPRTVGTAASVVRTAYEQGIPLRTRAQGHSLNGSSLPAEHELLFSTRNFRHVRFDEPGSITAGAGVVLWILQHFLRRAGFDLPVLNDGYAGPSVGGYLAAGGFGPRSAQYGGVWDNVLAVRLIDGRGELHVLEADDARFPWLFGSMGQLGIFYDAKLAIVPLAGAEPAAPYPAGTTFMAPELAQPKVPPEFTVQENESLFWFTLFVPDEDLDAAHRELRGLEHAHRVALRFQERYRYPIRQRGRVAPLVYPHAGPFTATGAWGWLTDKSEQGTQRLLAFDRDFMALALSRPQWRRYIQSELAGSPQDYERCFGAHTYAALRALKAELDPRSLFNRGSVFPA
jgi:FAD/FMN-containing dehydrogenase